VQLFVIFFSRPVEFGIATAITVTMLLILLRAAMSAEGPSGIGRMMARPTTKFVFAFLFVAWAVVFGLGLIMMFTGFFIMMGFIWSVIGE